MKIFQCVIFILYIVSVICEEKDKRSTSDDFHSFTLNQGEYFPPDEGLYEFGDVHKYKNDYKHLTQPQFKQYLIIKKQKDYPVAKKILSVITSNLKKVSESIDPKQDSKVMPIKIVQEGPVKHIYLPGLYVNQPSSVKSSRTPKLHENFFQHEYKDIYPEQFEQNYFRPSTQYTYSPTSFSTTNQELFGHDLNLATNGYRVGKSQDLNFASTYNPQFLTKYPNPYAGNFYSSATQYVPQTLTAPTHSSFDIPSTKSFSFDTKPLYFDKPSTSSSYFDIPSHKPLSFDIPSTSSSFGISSAKHPLFDVSSNIPSSFNIPSTNPVKYQQEHTYSHYPQFNTDNKSKLPSSDYYTRYTSTADSGQPNSDTTKFKPSEEFTPIVNTQVSKNTNKESKTTNLSNLDPELANLVNEVLKGKGNPTHDGFTMIKSKTDNSIYLIGKPGMSLNTIPDFSSYNFASFQKSEDPIQKKKEEKSAT